jgi:hypothetical protein
MMFAVPYRTSFMRDADRRLQKDLFARLEKPYRLERIEAAFHPIDVSVVRAPPCSICWRKAR